MEAEISSETWAIYWNLKSKLNDPPKRRYVSVTSQDIAVHLHGEFRTIIHKM
jgi:hypothetical protein